MSTIGSLAVNLIARTEKFTKPIRGARAEAKLLGKTLTSLKGVVVGFGATLAAGFTIRGLKQTADDIDRISKSARRLNITTESLVGLEHAANLSGVSVGRLQMALERVNILASDARMGDTEALQAFQRIGVGIDQLDRLKADKLLGRIADQINRFPDAADRAGAAAEFFGKKAGPGLLTLLEGGSQGLAAMQADAEKLGLTFNSIEGQKIEAANDALTRAMESVKGLARELTIALGPAVKKVADFLAETTIANKRFFGGTGPEQAARAEEFISSMSDKQFSDYLYANRNEGDLSGALQTAAAKRAEQMQKTAADNKSRSQRAVAEGGGRLAGGAMRKLFSLAGDGADALGKFGQKVEDINQKGAGAVLAQAFGFGPGTFDAARANYTPKLQAGLNDDELRSRLRALGVGSGRGVDVRGNAALERGTAAAFSQERRSSQQNQLLDEARKSNDLLEEAVVELKNISGENLGAALLPANVA